MSRFKCLDTNSDDDSSNDNTLVFNNNYTLFHGRNCVPHNHYDELIKCFKEKYGTIRYNDLTLVMILNVYDIIAIKYGYWTSSHVCNGCNEIYAVIACEALNIAIKKSWICTGPGCNICD